MAKLRGQGGKDTTTVDVDACPMVRLVCPGASLEVAGGFRRWNRSERRSAHALTTAYVA